MIAIHHKEIIKYMEGLNRFTIICIFLMTVLFYTGDFFLDSFIPQRIIDVLQIIGAATFIILALMNGIFRRILNTDIVLFFGKVSYSLYLLHFPILLVCESLFHDMTYLVFRISLTSTIVLSYVFYQYIEVYFINIGRKIKLISLNSLLDKYFFKFSAYFGLKKEI